MLEKMQDDGSWCSTIGRHENALEPRPYPMASCRRRGPPLRRYHWNCHLSRFCGTWPCGSCFRFPPCPFAILGNSTASSYPTIHSPSLCVRPGAAGLLIGIEYSRVRDIIWMYLTSLVTTRIGLELVAVQKKLPDRVVVGLRLYSARTFHITLSL